ncbi:MAG: hypothetical protein V3U93_02790 [Alphaproteobacteria bacterium]
MKMILRMKLHLPGVLLCFSLAVGAPAAMAGAEPFQPIDAKALIKPCWNLSEEKRASGVTATMRQGALDTVLCLEKVILDQVEILFPDGKYLSRSQAEKKLERLGSAIQTFYWSLYNEHTGCKHFCGTMWQVLHLAKNADFLEQMIRDLADQRNRYKIEGP